MFLYRQLIGNTELRLTKRPRTLNRKKRQTRKQTNEQTNHIRRTSLAVQILIQSQVVDLIQIEEKFIQ